MEFAAFLLDEWLGKHQFANPPVAYDLASSTGPGWTLRQLLELAGAEECERILDAKVGYTPAAGTPALREAIAEMQGVQPDEVQVRTGAAEALLVLFSLATEPGANVVVPSPRFPPSTKSREHWASRSAATPCSARTPIAWSSTPSAL
jgi:aspartate/methionine/tyrosine aminotransferase